jgi:hypothetical protein
LPLALIRGARSQLFEQAGADYLMSFCPPGSPRIDIPEADHHDDRPAAGFRGRAEGAARGVAVTPHPIGRERA